MADLKRRRLCQGSDRLPYSRPVTAPTVVKS
jgi:hypothetical protein